MQINDWLWEDKTQTDSTNDDAVALSQKLTTEKFIISAIRQNKGRGRRGRAWVGCDGNLFFSQGFPEELRFVGQMVCLSAVSLCQTVTSLLPAPHKVQIKWPNDILVDDCKISGTLLEKGEGDYLIIGTGVNIKQAPQGVNTLYKTAALTDFGINIDRLTFLRSYIDNFDNNYALWQSSGFAEIRRAWLDNVKALGNEIVVRTTDKEIRGIFTDIGFNGELHLQVDGENQNVYAGDVFFIKKDN